MPTSATKAPPLCDNAADEGGGSKLHGLSNSEMAVDVDTTLRICIVDELALFFSGMQCSALLLNYDETVGYHRMLFQLDNAAIYALRQRA